ncbi:MAG: Vitamin B12-dependent ribonucleoside-diphosphate reductase [Candidatus Woesearchaeota archaeon]|nr:Vitamin B12-dependent ribonucleoside-diphosphate reductase [Candidatus Woesearchaeota archaeon]
MKKIKKRDGSIADFNDEKITRAIFLASDSVGRPDPKLAKELTTKVVAQLENSEVKTPTVDLVHDTVEKILMQSGHSKIAKSYILYREKRNKLRHKKSLLGIKDELKLCLNASKVLKKKFLKKDKEGNAVESIGDLFRRVAENVASADKKHDLDPESTKEKFYKTMSNLEFLPNAPTLRNAGRKTQQLSACFVLPIEDSMESIFDAVKYTAILCQKGGGVGFNFGNIRPRGDYVSQTVNIAGGPISFMNIFDTVAKEISNKGFRAYGMMGILPVHHPQIMEFITAKDDGVSLTSFNMSVGLTKDFMNALLNDQKYSLINPRTDKKVGALSTKKVFDTIAEHAWRTGEPGVIFLDRMNKDNATPHIGKIESTNPCGEQPLLPFESCNLGSINLTKMLKFDDHWTIDWERLKKTVQTAVHFLDNVIEMNEYPIKEVEEVTLANRKIGLGLMGFADILIKLGISYNSQKAVELAEEIMKFISDEGRKASEKLGQERGSFPNFKNSLWDKKGHKHMRNATITTIAPTGTLSLLADCNGGIEPLFALAYTNKSYNRKDGKAELEMVVINKMFEQELKKRDLYNGDVMRKVAQNGTIKEMDFPQKVKDVFVTAHDITPEWHVRIQAAFQKYTDNAVSKTVNFPHDACVDDVKDVYLLSYKLGSKGITIYRDKSRTEQVLNIDSGKKKRKSDGG